MDTDDSWLDALVELHVLAEHGDRGAATAAARWLDRDEDARRAWDTVQLACDRVRGSGTETPRSKV